jgi:acyl-CoA thioester hydrolase
MSDAPASHEIRIPVDPADIDELGHVNNVTYLRWVQEAAVAHWCAQAAPEDQAKLVWVVVRHEIDYKQPAVAGDVVMAKTWVGTATRVRFERLTELRRASDGTVLANARTLWCPLDRETRRLAQVSAGVREVFSVP